MRVIVRWSWLIAICGVTAALLALAISSTLPPEYESRSMLLVGSTTATDPSQQLGYQQLAQTYATLSETPVVLRPVAATLGLDPSELRARVSAESLGGQRVVDVVARGGTPDDARSLAAAVAAQITQLSQTQADPPESLAVVVEEATLPDSASSPSTMLNVLIATVLGVLVGTLLVFTLDGARTRRALAEQPSTQPPQGRWPTHR